MNQAIKVTPMTIAQLLPSVDVPACVSKTPILGLSINSQLIQNGYIFVAMKGAHTHGREYISDAVQRGAVALLIDSTDNISSENCSIPVILITELELSLSEIAGRFYGCPTRAIPVVGVTGTNGKTTCSQLYAQLNALLGLHSGVVGTLGYGSCSPKWHEKYKTYFNLTSTGMTTPDAITMQSICAELVNDGNSNVVMEVSSHGLAQGRIAAIDINTAVFTNLSHDHLDYHESMENYGAAKAKLFQLPSVQSAVINIDDPFSAHLLSVVSQSVTVVEYSVHNIQANIYLSDIDIRSGNTHAVLNTPEGCYPFSTTLIGDFNLSNLLAVVSIAYLDGKNLLELTKHIPFLVNVSGRMENIDNKLNKKVIVDYAHTPDALENVLVSAKKHSLGQLWCVFGCGGDRDKNKRPVMATIADKYADSIVITSDNPRTENPGVIIDDITQGFVMKTPTVIPDREAAIHFAISESKENDTIIIAGKGHENFQLIGDQKYTFSDQKVAALAIRTLEGEAHD